MSLNATIKRFAADLFVSALPYLLLAVALAGFWLNQRVLFWFGLGSLSVLFLYTIVYGLITGIRIHIFVANSWSTFNSFQKWMYGILTSIIVLGLLVIIISAASLLFLYILQIISEKSVP